MNNYSVDLIKQMAECDANYIRLLKLLPHLQSYRDNSFFEHASFHNPDVDYAQPSYVNSTEPEKALEGICSEFVIADLEGSNEQLTVELKIVEAFKYTTTLEIIQKPQFENWMTNPSMLVRAYHDANTAEVVSYQGHRKLKPRYAPKNPQMYHSDEKMQVNAFLGEWLSHCLQVGRSTKSSDRLLKA